MGAGGGRGYSEKVRRGSCHRCSADDRGAFARGRRHHADEGAAGPVAAGYDWSGFYAGGHLGVAWGSSNWTASTTAAPTPGVSGSFGLFQPIDTFKRDRKLLRGAAGRLQLHAAEPLRRRRRDRRIVSQLSKSQRHLHRRYLDIVRAGDRRGELQRDDAVVRHAARPHRLRARQLVVLCDRRVCLGLRPADADANGERGDRIAVLVAVWLGGRRRRRGAGGAALDRAARISVHRLRRQQRDLPGHGPAVQFRLFAAGAARGAELSLRQRCGAREHHGHQGARYAGPRQRQFSRPNHVRLAGLSGVPLGLCRSQQPAERRRGPRDLRRHALCRRAAVARRRAVDRPRDRSGFRLCGYTHGVAGFPSAEAYKLGATYPYARVQRYFVRQTIDLGGEKREGGRRHQSVRRHADREPPGADGRQVRRRRHLRHQQICQQSQEPTS